MRPRGIAQPTCGWRPSRLVEVLGIGVTGPLAVEGAEEAAVPGTDLATALTPDRDAERHAWAVLAGVHGLGPVGFVLLLEAFGTATAVLRTAGRPSGRHELTLSLTRGTGGGTGLRPDAARAVAEAISASAARAERTLGRIRNLGLSVVTIADAAYPRRLASVDMPPHVLYVLGDPAALDARAAIAVVGTRRATDAGRAVAARIARDLVTVGASVVSGLAVGIDGAAHAAAVHAGGTTVAVLGSGHGSLHPRAHARLASSIVAAGGALVSELAPDVAPSRGTFPRRNRIISGLADAVVVVEAPARSGALITASWALEQGRGCFIVPGGIDAAASAGCLAFLREFPDHARIVAGVPQLIDDLGLADHLAEPGVSSATAATLADLGLAGRRLGRELVIGRATVDELVAVTGWPVASVLAGLTLLEQRGLAVGIHGRFRPAGELALAEPSKRSQRPRRRA
jgi:DNA processing protein